MKQDLQLLGLVQAALDQFRARCFDNAVYDLEKLDQDMANRIGRRLIEKGGHEGFLAGRRIMATAACL